MSSETMEENAAPCFHEATVPPGGPSRSEIVFINCAECKVKLNMLKLNMWQNCTCAASAPTERGPESPELVAGFADIRKVGCMQPNVVLWLA